MANLVQIVFNWNFEDLQMARHPGAGQEKVGAWSSPDRAELTLSLSSPAAQGWRCRWEGGKMGTEASGVSEGSSPKRPVARGGGKALRDLSA